MKRLIEKWRAARPYFWLHTKMYAVAYILVCFVNWKLYNPVQWVINLPDQSMNDRIGVLCCAAGWLIVVIAFTQILKAIRTPKN